MRYTITAVLCFGFFLFAEGKKSDIDSLKKELQKKDLHDTSRINTLIAIASEFKKSVPDTALKYLGQALSISQKNDWLIGKANAYYETGTVHRIQSDYKQALENYKFAIDAAKEAFYSSSTVSEKEAAVKLSIITVGSIGLVYRSQSDYPKALKFYFIALELSEKIKDKNKIAPTLGNIGLVYAEEGNYTKALEYYFRGKKLAEEMKNKKSLMSILANIGSVYSDQSDADYVRQKLNPADRDAICLRYYTESLKYAEELGARNYIAQVSSNIGIVYSNQPDEAFIKQGLLPADRFAKTMEYYNKALTISEEFGDKREMGIVLANMGTLYLRNGKFKEAKESLERSLQINETVGMKLLGRDALRAAARLYDSLAVLTHAGKTVLIDPSIRKSEAEYLRLAFTHYKNYIALRDSLTGEEQQKSQMRAEMNYEFQKKEALAQAEHEKQLLQKDAEQRKQSMYVWIIACIAIAAGVIAVIVLRSLRVAKRQQKVIEMQKHMVEEKQKEVLDSIRYARRIQRALITNEKYIERNLKKLTGKQ